MGRMQRSCFVFFEAVARKIGKTGVSAFSGKSRCRAASGRSEAVGALLARGGTALAAGSSAWGRCGKRISARGFLG